MKNTFKKVVLTGAIALAPIIAANSAMAAPMELKQVPNQLVNKNCSNVIYINKIFHDKAELKQYLTKWYEEIQKQIHISKPPVHKPVKPEGNKPGVEKPEVGKPEGNKPGAEKPVNPGENKPTKPEENNNANSDFASQVIDLVNKERAKAGLQPLKSDAALNKVAMIKAKDMYDNNYFSHQSPTLGSPFDLMRAQGINYNTAGENIAKGQRSPQEVMNAWMNSDGHRKNIMSSSFTSIGVAYHNGVWVQAFTG